MNAWAEPCRTLSPKTVGKPLATEVPAAMADQTRHDATVAVLRLTTSTARPAMRLQVLKSRVKLKDASNPVAVVVLITRAQGRVTREVEERARHVVDVTAVQTVRGRGC